MNIQFARKISTQNGFLLISVFSDSLKKLPHSIPESVKKFILDAVKRDNFKAGFGDSIQSHIFIKNLPAKLLVMGLGKEKNFTAKKSRIIGSKIAKLCKQIKTTGISTILTPKIEEHLEEFLEGIMLVQYDLGKFKTNKKKKTYNLEKVELIFEKQNTISDDRIKKAKLICETVSLVKDLVNGPSNIIDADYLVEAARKIARENKLKLTVFGKKELEKMKWGGLLAVNQGSKNEPKCLILEYKGAKDHKEKPIVLIGKGVVFDTGGYNLKPTNSIETMQQDMAGAAAVLGIFEMLPKLGIAKNIIGITPIVENLVSSTAYRPADIITMLSGKTVEITNTDAEGRLILADAITYGGRLNPQFIITIATLTGAVAVALGDRYAGVLGNDPKLSRALVKAGREVDELAWPLPLHADFKKKMDSLYADMQNCDLGTSRMAGSSKGAAFLARFFGKNKWAHIDIGGTGFVTDPQEFQTKGATAYGVRLLARFLENL